METFNWEIPAQQGWVCPRCKRVNAPWVSQCDCKPSQISMTWEVTTGEPVRAGNSTLKMGAVPDTYTTCGA